MIRLILVSFLFAISATISAQPAFPATPDKIYGELFIDVQTKKIFPDNKTFVDCIAKSDPKEIVRKYSQEKSKEGFDLKSFVMDNFDLPAPPPALNYVMQEKDVTMHIQNLWSVLTREADKENPNSSLLPLPKPYIIPGGRFREIYYWDSYFTMQGLKASGQTEIIENMVENFAYLIRTYGHIPNGNRSYYLSRSQPPFFALMVELLASIKGESIYTKYLNEMEHEYAYWMEGASSLRPGESYKRVVRMKDGTYLNRYWDDEEKPRQESYTKDVETVEQKVSDYISNKRFASEEAMQHITDSIRRKTYRDLRAGACSGWDFSNRWFEDGKNLASIETTDIIPVDLNSLMQKNQEIIIKARKIAKVNNAAGGFDQRGDINKYFWNPKVKFYTDYHFINNQKINKLTLAGMFPLCFNTESMKNQKLKASAMAEVLKKKFLKPGGLISVEKNTGQQWDAPNGWAPLQWMSIWGLDRCGQKALAKDIAQRWIRLNTKVYIRTGKLMEKYNVENLSLEAGGGEYPGQDGFGWTNGVLLGLVKKYSLPSFYFK